MSHKYEVREFGFFCPDLYMQDDALRYGIERLKLLEFDISLMKQNLVRVGDPSFKWKQQLHVSGESNSMCLIICEVREFVYG